MARDTPGRHGARAQIRTRHASPQTEGKCMQAAEGERLTRSMGDLSTSPVRVVVRCGACLGFLSLLVIVGSGTGDDAAAPRTPSADRSTVSARDDVRAAAHRKQLFDERRARFDGHAADVGAIPSARSSHGVTSAP